MTTSAGSADVQPEVEQEPPLVLVELSQVLLGTEPLTQILHRVADLARTSLPDVDDVSVTLVEDGRPRSVVFTGHLAAQLDERQYEAGFGPCLEAARSGQVVEIADTAEEARFADFARQAARSGVTRVLAVGLPVPGGTVGALNLYPRTGRGFDEAVVSAAGTFALHAAVLLANAALYARAAGQVGQMREAMASRSAIEQAKGVIMALLRCTPDEAFAELSRMSSSRNRKVRDVAQDIVDSHGLDV